MLLQNHQGLLFFLPFFIIVGGEKQDSEKTVQKAQYDEVRRELSNLQTKFAKLEERIRMTEELQKGFQSMEEQLHSIKDGISEQSKLVKEKIKDLSKLIELKFINLITVLKPI
nr:PREDICTED: uncharacterized protein LOC109041668 [Bemisia tabaci]